MCAPPGSGTKRTRKGTEPLAPVPIWTLLTTSKMPHEKYEELGADTPTERPGQPSDLAPVYVFLASQESSYVRGEVMGVTGGCVGEIS